MIKLMILVKRKAELSSEAFKEHLSITHAGLVRDCPATGKYVRKYVQSFCVAGEPDDRSFDGAVELWFDSLEDMDRFFADPNYLATVRPDEPRFAALEKCFFLTTEEAQVI